MTKPAQGLQSLQQFSASLLIFAGAALLVGVALLFMPAWSFFAWPLFTLGLISLTVGSLTYVARIATQAVIDAIRER